MGDPGRRLRRSDRKSETGSSCVKESASVRESWWAWPIAWSRCWARSSSRPWTARAWSRRRSSGSTGPWPTSAADLEAVVQKVAEELGDSEADIFKSHLQIVNDPALLSKVHALIENQQLTALSALAGRS